MTNLSLFAQLILRVGLICGLIPAIALAIYLELRGVRIVRVGVERVSGRPVSRRKNRHQRIIATSSPRKVRRAA